MRPAFEGILGDLGLAARRLRATPLFLIFAVASIAIGIATTTAAYSVLYAALWKPFGITQPEDVAVVGMRRTGGVYWRTAVSPGDFELLAARQQTLDALSAFATVRYTMVTPSSSQVSAFDAVSGRFFQTIRVTAVRGRMIQPDDEARRVQVLVITDATWRKGFASDPDVVGKAVTLGGRPFEIIGIAPASFDGFMPFTPVAGWIPLKTSDAMTTTAVVGRPGDRPSLAVLGRLGSGRTLIAAASEIEAVSGALDVEVPTRGIPMANGTTMRAPRAWTLRSIETADDNSQPATFAALLLGLVALVLVVACTNLGNLTLSRGAYRRHELAVRRALGATRGRLVRELFAETVLIAVLASVCTVLLTRVLLLFSTLEVSTRAGTIAFEPQMNTSALLFSVVALAISMIVFGLEPAFALTGRRAVASLAEGVSTFGAGSNTRQRAFIRWQVAISVCFFLIAATIFRVIASQAFHDPGIAMSELAISSVGDSRQVGVEELRRSVERAAEIARQRSELRSVAVAHGLPFGYSGTPFARLTVPGRPLAPGVQPPSTLMIAGSPEIFHTFGVPILRGRAFDDRDSTSTSRVVVVSEWTATQLFGSLDDALGKTIALQQWNRGDHLAFTVIGVARQTDVDHLTNREDHLVYVPLREAVGRSYALAARTTGNLGGAARILQEALREAAPDVGSGISGPASWVVATSQVVGRFAAALAGGLSLLTLILAMIGLYGVQVQTVVFRTREVGVRMALGAAASQIQGMVLRQGIRPVLEGVVLGVFFGAVTRAMIKWALADARMQVIEPAVFAAVPIPFAIAALIACYLPARRASRVEPNVALRHL